MLVDSTRLRSFSISSPSSCNCRIVLDEVVLDPQLNKFCFQSKQFFSAEAPGGKDCEFCLRFLKMHFFPVDPLLVLKYAQPIFTRSKGEGLNVNGFLDILAELSTAAVKGDADGIITFRLIRDAWELPCA